MLRPVCFADLDLLLAIGERGPFLSQLHVVQQLRSILTHDHQYLSQTICQVRDVAGNLILRFRQDLRRHRRSTPFGALRLLQ